MSADDRLRRPKPRRTAPIRGFSSSSSGTGTDGGQATAAPPTDPISGAVELGYRVVDEYIRQGQKAAQRLSEGRFDPGELTADWQQQATRMAQLTTEWMSMWFNLAQRATAGATMQPPRAAHQDVGAAAPAEHSAAEPARVRVDLHAVQPVAVTLELPIGAANGPLVVHNLRAADAKLPRLTDVSFAPARDGETAVLSIRVPARHPVGTYTGAIVDAQTNRTVGRLSVRIDR